MSAARVSNLLASWKTSLVLMILAALYYGLLSVWAISSPPSVVRSIAGLAPFWAVYLLLLLNTLWCLGRRLPGLAKDLRSRRWAALGTFLFHGAFLLFAVGFLLTFALRGEQRVWVAVGESFTGAPEQILSRDAPRLGPGEEPDVRFEVEEIAPEFWRDRLLFTSLWARLRMEDGSERTTRINAPLWVSSGTFLRLSGFGYALRYELAGPDGTLLESNFVKLNVFPPGRRDAIVLQDFPYRLYVELYPDMVQSDRGVETRSMNLRRPGFLVHAYRGKVDLGARLLLPGEPMPLEGFAVRIPEVRYWAELALLGDPGAPVVLFSFALALAGLVLKLVGRRA